MDKLIELFNEHIEENTGQKYYLNERDVKDKLDSLLILRHFIKWLVDNKKINYEKCIKEFMLKDFRKFYYLSKADNVIANLSIKNNPIDFLLSILK